MDPSELTKALVELLTEAYAGPPDPSSTWFIDNEPDSGILGIIAGVSAAEASWSTSGGSDPGTTIAAHVEHLRWSLANARSDMRGEGGIGSWSKSWEVVDADEAAWDRLRQDLRREYTALRDEILNSKEVPAEALIGAIALIPHAAYHLGNIRQLVERARQA